MIAPLEATATKIGSGYVQAGAPTAASATKARQALTCTAIAVRTSCPGDQRPTSRLVTQPAEISPMALTPNARP